MQQGFKYILLQSCTGSGKTATAASFIQDAIAKQRTIHFIVHRKDLIIQTMTAFDNFGLDYSIIAAGYRYNPFARLQICSIDTLKNRLDKIPHADLVFFDEVHLSGSEGWTKVMNHYKAKGSWVIGLTATPVRLDGKGLGMHFQRLIQGPSMKWLIENKFLSDYLLFAPSTPDMTLGGSLTKKAEMVSMGDFKKEVAEAAMDKPVITGNAIKHYKRHAMGKLALCYCVSREHSRRVVEEFIAAGIPAAHIDGETSMEDRKRIIVAFARREILVLCNVELITTGFDLANYANIDVTVECIILLRPTQSLSLYLQMVGRGLRYKLLPCIILDHAGNFDRLGYPDDEHDWTLDDRCTKTGSGGEKTIKAHRCPQCFFGHRPRPTCPQCNYVYPIDSRVVEEVDGDLVQIDKDAIRKDNRKKQGMAKTIEELTAQFIAQGSTPWKAAKRAAYIITAREAKNK